MKCVNFCEKVNVQCKSQPYNRTILLSLRLSNQWLPLATTFLNKVPCNNRNNLISNQSPRLLLKDNTKTIGCRSINTIELVKDFFSNDSINHNRSYIRLEHVRSEITKFLPKRICPCTAHKKHMKVFKKLIRQLMGLLTNLGPITASETIFHF